MQPPLFYSEKNVALNESIVLDEDTSRHIIQVLRMKKSEQLQLTDGKGNLLTGSIIDDHKKKVVFRAEGTRHEKQGEKKITLAVSLLKNNSRFEWLLEKATEIGITEIIPMICERTERQHFRLDRMRNILVSAMLQSRQCWLPVINEPVQFKQAVETAGHQQKFIAHCIEEEKRNLADLLNESLPARIVLIGPEGDFTNEEVGLALKHHFVAASLGENRLRAETAGIVAATLLKFSS